MRKLNFKDLANNLRNNIRTTFAGRYHDGEREIEFSSTLSEREYLELVLTAKAQTMTKEER